MSSSGLAACPVDCRGVGVMRRAAEYFGDCVCNPRDAASLVVGVASVAAWSVAELPQIVANYRNGASEGVSFAFIVTWLTGDAFNLLGCAVSPTLPTQMYTAVLYTATTVVLVAQHAWYKSRGRKGPRVGEGGRPSDAAAEALLLEASSEDEEEGGGERSVAAAGVRAVAMEAAAVAARRARPGEVEEESDAGRRMSLGDGRRFTPSSARTFKISPLALSFGDRSSFGQGSTLTSALMRAGGSPVASGNVFEDIGEQARSATSRTVADGCASGSGDVSQPPPVGGGRGRGGLSLTLATAATSLSLVGFVASSVASYGGVNRAGAIDGNISGVLGRSVLGVDSDDGYAHKPLIPAPPWVGAALGWTMTVIYLSGRAPQILMNHHRGSVEGLAIPMFTLAVIGNATYMASILIRSCRWSRIRPNLPWLVDAGMCLVMDAVIIGQYAWYMSKVRRERANEEYGAGERVRSNRGDEKR